MEKNNKAIMYSKIIKYLKYKNITFYDSLHTYNFLEIIKTIIKKNNITFELNEINWEDTITYYIHNFYNIFYSNGTFRLATNYGVFNLNDKMALTLFFINFTQLKKESISASYNKVKVTPKNKIDIYTYTVILKQVEEIYYFFMHLENNNINKFNILTKKDILDISEHHYKNIKNIFKENDNLLAKQIENICIDLIMNNNFAKNSILYKNKSILSLYGLDLTELKDYFYPIKKLTFQDFKNAKNNEAEEAIRIIDSIKSIEPIKKENDFNNGKTLMESYQLNLL